MVNKFFSFILMVYLIDIFECEKYYFFLLQSTLTIGLVPFLFLSSSILYCFTHLLKIHGHFYHIIPVTTSSIGCYIFDPRFPGFFRILIWIKISEKVNILWGSVTVSKYAEAWLYLSCKNSHLLHCRAFRYFCPEVIYSSLNQTVLYF